MAWPTTDDPRTEVITFRLTKKESKAIDRLRKRLGVKTRSEAVRTAVSNEIERSASDG